MKKEFLIKFIRCNSKMIKFIWSNEFYSDAKKLARSSSFANLNRKLFRDLISCR